MAEQGVRALARLTDVNTKKLIDRCVLLHPEPWHALTIKVSWHYRTHGDRPFPAKLLSWLGGYTPTREEWRRLRRRITNQRKYLAKQERFHQARQRVDQRRTYMRRYMRDRRATT